MKKVFIILSMGLFLLSAEGFKNGDIIFQDSFSSQSKAIKLATHSKYSHMGIVYNIKEKIYVFEASKSVQMTPLKKWISRGKNRHYVVKRLKDSSLLTSKSLKKMYKVSKTFVDKPYDSLFGWSDQKIYCSELVWKIYKRALGIELGSLKKLKEFDLSSPLVKVKLVQRYGKNIPLNEKVIDPQTIFDSALLKTVNF